MKTNWVAPNEGNTIRELVAEIAKHLPDEYYRVNGLSGRPGKTRLAISTTGTWESYDVDRIIAAR
jgi:hypothetical protein